MNIPTRCRPNPARRCEECSIASRIGGAALLFSITKQRFQYNTTNSAAHRRVTPPDAEVRRTESRVQRRRRSRIIVEKYSAGQRRLGVKMRAIARRSAQKVQKSYGESPVCKWCCHMILRFLCS
jgi:hypothetical protein